jgi:alpha-glucuronidase
MIDQDLKEKLQPEDGYELWLRYKPIADAATLEAYQASLTQIIFEASSKTLGIAQQELRQGLNGLLGTVIPLAEDVQDGTLIIGTPQYSRLISGLSLEGELASVGAEGFVIARTQIDQKECLVITANTDIGILYGVFRFLQHLQTYQSLNNLHIMSAPKLKYRILNHWDNLDGTIERGYAGFSLWDWHKLPDYIAPRYIDYARTNASLGINSVVLTNVNANALILTPLYLVKVAALADVFRPYGIRVFLTARFSAPREIGQLKTADPLDPEVIAWWEEKIDEIYEHIPDFGGFAVKANSEGQPGPHDYGRTHADGANMLAKPLEAHGGIVCWRAFVYDHDVPEDRAKQANNQLVPQDGLFRNNVLLQVKNGPIDFQPREPHHPLFGAMPKTPLMLEVQITQEYLGLATNLAYLAPMYKETLDADTYCYGAGSQVSKIVDGSLDGHDVTGMAGVTNIGSDRNWCGHPFGAANWFTFGRLAWDHALTSEEIADEWLRMTFNNEERFVESAKTLMMMSREAVVNYMTPLGLHHIMARGHHYGPGPWVDGGRADWTSVYYHRADAIGIGFDRTSTGSDAVSQYFPPYREEVSRLDSCPEALLLWFHHVSWQHQMKSGHTLWDELCHQYNLGVEQVQHMQQIWASLEVLVDEARFEMVSRFLEIQKKEARWWRDACLLYFQTFSQLPIPATYEQPTETLEHYQNISHYYVPGIHERRF